MKVRAIDTSGDWEYGKGANDYKRDRKAVAQNIQTRLSSFLGNCFFDASAGIDWFGFLGGKDTLALQLAVSATILNTTGVLGILSLSVTLDVERRFTLFYKVSTVFGPVEAVIPMANLLTTEDGDALTTEDGQGILA